MMKILQAALVILASSMACAQTHEQHLRGLQQKLGDWQFCATSSDCNNGCCSTAYSDDGRLKCTPLSGGFNPNLCVGGPAPGAPTSAPAPTSTGLLGDWAVCNSNSACSNGCCSSMYSNGVLKCTPLTGGFNPNVCMSGPAPTPAPAPTSSGLLGDWALCSSNSACRNGCCSSMYSNGVLKCTPLSGGFNPNVCMSGPSPTPAPAPTNSGGGCVVPGAAGVRIWPSNGKGLRLRIVNALDTTWQAAFTAAIGDWERGAPDSLTLNVTRGQVDTVCEQKIDGLMKVCNRDFGATGWRGININWYVGNQIVASVAKMNDYYLRSDTSVGRQYTMCHEIGHGFGLPHTDETFNNPSLGDCMDYTNDKAANLHPGVFNYRRLASWYGTVGCRRVLGEEGTSSLSHHHDDKRILSEDLELEYKEAVAEIEQLAVRRALREGTLDSLWELVEDHPMGSVYVRTLGGEDYQQIEVHLLHAFPQD